MNTEETPDLDSSAPTPPPRSVSPFAKYLFLAVFLSGLLALFYAEENWRGRRAWEKARAELLARGEPLDWNKALETPPPDDQNVWKAPGIGPEFIKHPNPNPTPSAQFAPKIKSTAAPPKSDVQLGEIEFVSANSPAATTALHFGDLSKNPVARETFYRALIGRSFITPDGMYYLNEKAPSNVHLVVVANPAPTPEAMSDALTKSNPVTTRPPLRFTKVADRKLAVFRDADNWLTAQEFLDLPNERLQKLIAVHEAVKRPRAWIPGDYNTPFRVPDPNFVLIRTLAQYAGGRAQACVLLNRGAEALTNISYSLELNRLLQTRPQTLICAMIQVAISGLAMAVVEEGFAADVWSPEDLQTLEKKTSELNFVPSVVDSLRTGERIGVVHLLVNSSLSDVLSMFHIGDEKKTWRTRALRLIPRGWLYQNAANYARLMQGALDSVESNSQIIHPEQLNAWTESLESHLAAVSPFWTAAGVAVPNVAKALQTAAKNQTYARCAMTAAALELYRREHKEYPAKLDDLVPQYLPSVPQDLVAKGPLHYRRIDSQYVLYSPGWDGKDGVEPILAKLGADSFDLWTLHSPALRDDWVWKGVPSARQVQSLTASAAK